MLYFVIYNIPKTKFCEWLFKGQQQKQHSTNKCQYIQTSISGVYTLQYTLTYSYLTEWSKTIYQLLV